MNSTVQIDEKIAGQIQQLSEKYAAMGQDLSSYLEGLLYSNYLTYWDYIHLDTLLSLQNPRTDFPDEQIFIMYHQITELNFKLVLHEMSQLSQNQHLTADFFLTKLRRLNRYFEYLVHSFDVMTDGMDKEQFLKFRMSLLPASGFQSPQYRLIEICATDFRNLVSKEHRHLYHEQSAIESMFEHIYWKTGATELKSGKKTLTLRQFEEKYSLKFIETGKNVRHTNLWAIYRRSFTQVPQQQEIAAELRKFDVLVNVNWPLSHFKSAVRYLQKDPADIAATGGTNWQQYLPPRFQLRVFYPELWTDEELANWGKGIVK